MLNVQTGNTKIVFVEQEILAPVWYVGQHHRAKWGENTSPKYVCSAYSRKVWQSARGHKAGVRTRMCGQRWVSKWREHVESSLSKTASQYVLRKQIFVFQHFIVLTICVIWFRLTRHLLWTPTNTPCWPHTLYPDTWSDEEHSYSCGWVQHRNGCLILPWIWFSLIFLQKLTRTGALADRTWAMHPSTRQTLVFTFVLSCVYSMENYRCSDVR